LTFKSILLQRESFSNLPLGGISDGWEALPLDRTPNQNKVEAITRIFNKKEIFRLALSPEGTRKKTERWKTGFYYISRSAGVPVIKVAFDYGKKEVRISPPFYTYR
jgi:1-acyl-sn-glycerol-3-phosphate acyltransferase